MLTEKFQKSTRCKADSPQCVEVAKTAHGDVVVRDSKTSASLTYTPAEWNAFTEGAKAGEFDL